MPYSLRKKDGNWVVTNSDTGKVKGTHDSKAKADRQMNLLRAVKHGWRPSGEKASK